MARFGAIPALIVTAGALLSAGAATAQTTAYAPGQGSPNSIVLGIPVTASVGGACSFSTLPNANWNFPNLDGGFTQDTPFVLDCNIKSRVGVVSSEGGLKASVTPPAGYTNLAPYTVAVHMAGNGGAVADGSCAVETLTATALAPCSFRGPASFVQGLELNAHSNAQPTSYVRVSAPAYVGANALVSSTTYTDTLKVTVSASL